MDDYLKDFEEEWYERGKEIRQAPLSWDSIQLISMAFDEELDFYHLLMPNDPQEANEYTLKLHKIKSEVLYSLSIAMSNYKLQHKSVWTRALDAVFPKHLESIIKIGGGSTEK